LTDIAAIHKRRMPPKAASVACRTAIRTGDDARVETGSRDAETVLDLRGLRCPYPVLRAKKAMRAVPVGGVLVLECTDPLAVVDVPHFARQTGHELVDQEHDGSLYVFRIRKTK
jgi:tRNA 2-thiouridine synthesizing protein A